MDYTPYKELLLQMKEEVLTTQNEKIANTLIQERVVDELDIAAQDQNVQLQKRLLERKTFYIKRIDEALHKIKEGSYGYCEDCGEEISSKRLLARPVALLCILCKEKQEKREKADKSFRGFTSDEQEDV